MGGLKNSFLWIPVGITLLTGIVFSQGIVSSDLPAVPRPKPSGLPFHATFTDVAREAGLTARIVQGNPLDKKYILEANGTGVAFLDFDNDGLLDAFVVNGDYWFRSPKVPGPTSHLYRNTGAGKFDDVTVSSGLTRSGWGNGVCSADYDRDGFRDLYVTYYGANSLFHSSGNGKFEDRAFAAGVAGSGSEWSTGCTFLDYDRDGRDDLLVVSYAGFNPKRTPLPGQFPYCVYRDAPVFCGPRGLPQGRATLYHNVGDGRFEDVSVASGVRRTPGVYAFTASAADLNGDGWTDIYVACDSTPSLYFRNNKDGTFREIATESGLAYNENGSEQAGMGLAIADYNRDGTPDILKTNFIRDYPNLYRNSGKGFFEDQSVRTGLAVNPQYLLWGVGLEDLDNDGLRDVFEVAGHVYPNIATIDPGITYATPRLVYRQLENGRLEDVSALAGPGVAAAHSSRGAAFGDFDNDGDMDVLVMNMNEAPSLLRNDLKNGNHWSKVQLEGTKSSPDAAGASVTIYAAGREQTGFVLSQSSYLSVNDARLHFGLGAADRVDKIVVRWPAGSSEEFSGGPGDRLLLLKEGTHITRVAEGKQ